jgi:hypothetical protein
MLIMEKDPIPVVLLYGSGLLLKFDLFLMLLASISRYLSLLPFPFPLFIFNILILPIRFNINLQPQLLIQFQNQTLFLLKLIFKYLNLIQSYLTIIKSNCNKITFICKFNTLYF